MVDASHRERCGELVGSSAKDTATGVGESEMYMYMYIFIQYVSGTQSPSGRSGQTDMTDGLVSAVATLGTQGCSA